MIKRKKTNSIILNYDESSNSLFKWYQQLVAESLGKNSKGVLPFISNLPKDNHSLMQLYLDGNKNCFFTFFMMETILLGKMMKLNPFDQPSVELIKKETKRILI